MAEFCAKCWQELNGEKPRPAWTYQLGEGFCEGCGQERQDIVYGLHAGPVQMAVQYFKLKKQPGELEQEPRFNDEELAAFEKIYAAESDDERRIRIRELMEATKKKNKAGE